MNVIAPWTERVPVTHFGQLINAQRPQNVGDALAILMILMISLSLYAMMTAVSAVLRGQTKSINVVINARSVALIITVHVLDSLLTRCFVVSTLMLKVL